MTITSKISALFHMNRDSLCLLCKSQCIGLKVAASFNEQSHYYYYFSFLFKKIGIRMTRPSGTERHRQNCCRSWTKRISLIFFFLCYVFLGAYVFLIIESQQDTTNNDPAVQKHHHTPPTEEIRTASFDLSDEDDRQQKLQYEAMTRQALDKLCKLYNFMTEIKSSKTA